MKRFLEGNSYNKQHYKGVAIRLHTKYDKDVIQHLSKQRNKTDYIRRLIKADLERRPQ